VTHWHITATTPEKGVSSDIKYINSAKSILDYVDVVYEIFAWQLEEEDRTQYFEGMLSLSETGENYKVYTSSNRLALYWRDCEDDPCVVATYN